MSARETLLQEVARLPEWAVKDLTNYLALLKARRRKGEIAKTPATTWPEGYFERTAGAFANEPFERPAQLPYEVREDW